MRGEMGERRNDATATPVSSLSAFPFPLPSKYIGRWKHRLNLNFRVCPKFKETHKAIATMKEIKEAARKRAEYEACNAERTERSEEAAREPSTPEPPAAATVSRSGNALAPKASGCPTNEVRSLAK